MSREFVVVGESLVDIVVTPSGQTSEEVGGSPMNVAVGMARLDVPTLLITEIGDDARGQRIAEHVRASGARLAPSSIQADAVTSTATARLDADHAADYDFDLSWSLAPQALPDSIGLHVGSLGASLRPGRKAVLEMVHQAAAQDMFVSFDPNVRPVFVTDRVAAWKDLAQIAALSTLVKVSDEDVDALRPGAPVADVAAELLAGERTDLVIVTRGGSGASAFSTAHQVDVPAPSVDVADTVGAGDSFMAGALAILHEWELLGEASLGQLAPDRLRKLLAGAAAAAAVTCSRRGADPPTRSELPPDWAAG